MSTWYQSVEKQKQINAYVNSVTVGLLVVSRAYVYVHIHVYIHMCIYI